MKELEEEKRIRQQEKIDRLRGLSDEEKEQLSRDGRVEAERILKRFGKKPPQGRRG